VVNSTLLSCLLVKGFAEFPHYSKAQLEELKVKMEFRKKATVVDVEKYAPDVLL